MSARRICLQNEAVFAGIAPHHYIKMKPADLWKTAVFLATLILAAAIVGDSRKAQAPTLRPPMVRREVIWPVDVPPTRIIHIPATANPTTSTMDLVLHPGDELEFDLEPMWDFHVHWDDSAAEVAVSGGNRFMPIMEYEKYVKQAAAAGAGPWWTKSRVARFHLRPGISGESTMKFMIEKRPADEGKPPPIVQRPVIWPGDVPATQIIHIPDPQHPSSGTMEYRLHNGDELEFDLEPMWDFHVHWDGSATEIAVDGGD